ncbi:MAG: imidazole glycerol phosphate synthase subunit HisH [Zetaproteobacteria bacterium]|nr:imidazole glycerol phosphate synthase subunit HisH [Zetaproteobacteria bacterium]
MVTVGLIDYGMGNMHSVTKALEKAGSQVVHVHTPEALMQMDRIVLPGVGAFRDCMAVLQEKGLDEAILERIQAGMPFLGICLGMQVLMQSSMEFGFYQGLKVIPGAVKPFPETHPERGFKIPHMGWNDVLLGANHDHPVLSTLQGQQVYYVHSYVCVPDQSEHILAACSYGDHPFACAIGHDNVLGVQFHPEKSQQAGLNMLKAFIDWRI